MVSTIPPGRFTGRFNRGISVVLPAYNEEAVIRQTVIEVIQKLTPLVADFEIIVVNDGSKDKTRQVVEYLAWNFPQVRLINHPVNRGYGSALVTGFTNTRKELVFFMDSDGQFDIADLALLLPHIHDHDAVLGYRIHRQDRWMRTLNAWGWKCLIRVFFGVKVRDVDCAFKLFRADFFYRYPLETTGAMINTEIMYKWARAGYSYTEVGVRHLPRTAGSATGAKLSVILRALREMFIYAEKWSQA
jgi:glycosyltransferase involved in cell wall biosynthesis